MEFSLKIKDIDYDSALPILIPLAFTNKAKAKAASLMIKAAFKGKNNADRNEILTRFINEHRKEIVKKINERILEYGIDAVFTDITANI